MKLRNRDWYFTPQEWNKAFGWGIVPDERNWLLLTKQQQTAVQALSNLGR